MRLDQEPPHVHRGPSPWSARESRFEDAGVASYRVSYGELVAHPAEVTNATLTPPVAREYRMSNPLKEDWATRFRADLARDGGGGQRNADERLQQTHEVLDHL